MAVLSGSIEANVPIKFADKEWSEFMWRSLYGSYAKGFSDVSASLSEIDADDGTVNFETEGDQLVRVSVKLDYTPRTGAGADEEVARAQQRLTSDLEKYRTFLLRRCDEERCRAA